MSHPEGWGAWYPASTGPPDYGHDSTDVQHAAAAASHLINWMNGGTFQSGTAESPYNHTAFWTTNRLTRLRAFIDSWDHIAWSDPDYADTVVPPDHEVRARLAEMETHWNNTSDLSEETEERIQHLWSQALHEAGHSSYSDVVDD